MRRKTPEGYVLDAVMQYLAVKKVFAIRMNSGAVKIDSRFLRFGSPGMADVLAFETLSPDMAPDRRVFVPTWIEIKAPKGKQSDLQKSFAEKVKAEGHRYILCYGINDLVAAGL